MGFLKRLVVREAVKTTVREVCRSGDKKARRTTGSSVSAGSIKDDTFGNHPVGASGRSPGSSSYAGSSSANHGAGWSMDEENRLRDGYNRGTSISELSVIHGRSEAAIRHRLAKLGYSV
jgi:hypothetical protein